MSWRGVRVYAAGLSKDYGIATGSTHKCQLAGCRGVRVTVKWDPFLGPRITHPCSHSLFEGPEQETWRIG